MPIFMLPPSSGGDGNRCRRPRYSPGNAEHASVYKTARWQALRMAIIAERGFRCEDKGHRRGQVIDRLDLDHVVEMQDGGAPFDPANLILRCRACHGRKTARAKRDRETRQFWLQRARRGG